MGLDGRSLVASMALVHPLCPIGQVEEWVPGPVGWMVCFLLPALVSVHVLGLFSYACHVLWLHTG